MTRDEIPALIEAIADELLVGAWCGRCFSSLVFGGPLQAPRSFECARSAARSGKKDGKGWSCMSREKEVSDVHGLLRLEVCLPKNDGAVWFLIDWVKPGKSTVAEVMRILSRFNRMALSLQRQSERVDHNVPPARNEPYAHLLGVRCRMVDRVIGVHYRKTHESVQAARTATANENQAELEFQLLRSGTEA